LLKEDDRETLSKKAIAYYSTRNRKELWTYEETPEEIHKDPEYGKAMDDLFLANNEDSWDIESLVYMRKYVDPEITAAQMKQWSGLCGAMKAGTPKEADWGSISQRVLRS
jgi:hypothetical protein